MTVGVCRCILVQVNKAIKVYSGEQEYLCCLIVITKQSFFIMKPVIPKNGSQPGEIRFYFGPVYVRHQTSRTVIMKLNVSEL